MKRRFRVDGLTSKDRAIRYSNLEAAKKRVFDLAAKYKLNTDDYTCECIESNAYEMLYDIDREEIKCEYEYCFHFNNNKEYHIYIPIIEYKEN